MKAPKTPTVEKKIKIANPIRLDVEKPKVVKKKKVPSPKPHRRIIETKYDLFEAIDFSELLSVI